jgi:hypothetical protein
VDHSSFLEVVHSIHPVEPMDSAGLEEDHRRRHGFAQVHIGTRATHFDYSLDSSRDLGCSRGRHLYGPAEERWDQAVAQKEVCTGCPP